MNAPVRLESGFRPGICFGLDEAEYHAVPALSNSGIKHLLVSPMDFYMHCPWLNAGYVDEPSPAMELGRAYHVRIVEGRAAFGERYAAALDPADFPAALRTMEEIKAALPEGEKRGGSKAELISRLLEHRPEAPIWDLLVQRHQERHGDRLLLPPEQMRRIEIAAAMIEQHPALHKAFSGGYPEVSIFWIDEETGVPMKMRTDYLKVRAIVDLKTFANPFGKPFDRAVTAAMANGRHHIQAAVYQEGVAAARAMLARQGSDAVRGAVDAAWLARFAAGPPATFMFVFQASGPAPVARGYEYPRALNYECGRAAVRECRQRYMENFQRFGTDPWIDTSPVRRLDDTEFPAWMTEW